MATITTVPLSTVRATAAPALERAGIASLDPFEFVRTIAVARITMPKAMVRLSAGREQMDDVE